MTTVFRGISGSQFVFSEGTPPSNATNITIYSEAATAGGTDRGSFDSILDLPNAKSSSTNLNGLAIGDFATVLSESSETFYCTDATQGAASWSQAVGLPPDFSDNLAAWWEADRGITLSGNEVVSWADWSGNTILLTSSAGDRPSFVTSSGGRAAVSFDGATQRLSAGDVLDMEQTSLTFFLVLSSSAAASQRIVQKRAAGSFGTQSGYLISNFGSNGNFQQIGFDDGANFASPGAPTDLWGDGNIHVLTVQFDRTAGTARGINDSNTGTAQSATNAALINYNITNANDFTIGASSTSPPIEYFGGGIMAIICYRALLTGSGREKVEMYLRRKYKPEAEFSF